MSDEVLASIEIEIEVMRRIGEAMGSIEGDPDAVRRVVKWVVSRWVSMDLGRAI